MFQVCRENNPPYFTMRTKSPILINSYPRRKILILLDTLKTPPGGNPGMAVMPNPLPAMHTAYSIIVQTKML